MTVVVAFLCSDGAVIAADSMITTSIGGRPVGHLKGKKTEVLQDNQIFAYAGDQGQGARFRILTDGYRDAVAKAVHPIDYPLDLTEAILAQFQKTLILNTFDVDVALGFLHNDQPCCAVFEGALQPRLLDQVHFFASLGSGKQMADPFLRFIVDVFCNQGVPNVREAIFLATWIVEHVIETNPGGVAGPITIVTIEKDATSGDWGAVEIPDTEIDEHRQAIKSAGDALRAWRDGLQSGEAAEGTDAPPQIQT